MQYALLAVAILAEVIGTSALKPSDQFTKFVPSLVVAVGYGASFYCMSIVLKTMPVGVVYAIWSGCGIVLVSFIAFIFFKQSLDTAAMVGIGLIVAGVVSIEFFSKSAGH